MNQVNAAPDKDIGNSCNLSTLLLLASPHYIINWPICSNVVLLSTYKENGPLPLYLRVLVIGLQYKPMGLILCQVIFG